MRRKECIFKFTPSVLVVHAFAGFQSRHSLILSFPAMGTAFKTAKEDGRTGGQCGGVQKRCGAGAI